jgi:hypothetical protein
MPDYSRGRIEWSDYWPEGARVPRVDPRVLDATKSRSERFAVDMLCHEADMLLRLACCMGMNITIERIPMKPLAMGNTEPVVTVWPKRGAA